MKLLIGNTTYTELKNLSFAPEIDVTNNTFPDNEFSVDVVTADDFSVGAAATLKDDLDNVWAKYRIASADRLSDNVVRVRAESGLRLIDKGKLKAALWTAKPLADAIRPCLGPLSDVYGLTPFTIDDIFANTTLSGPVPEQSRRERLHWILFTIGGMMLTAFVEKPRICEAMKNPSSDPSVIPVTRGTLTIPDADTYFRPQRTAIDKNNLLTVTAYEFAEAKGSKSKNMITVDDVDYLLFPRKFSVAKEILTAITDPKPFEIDGVTLISPDWVWLRNINVFAQHVLATHEIEADVINNASYPPGYNVSIATNADDLTERHEGVIGSESFSFGLQAKSHVKMTELLPESEVTNIKTVTVTHAWAGDSAVSAATLKTEQWKVPYYWYYSVTHAYRKFWSNPYDCVMRPSADETIDVAVSDASLTINYVMALRAYQSVLDVFDFDADQSTIKFYASTDPLDNVTITVNVNGVSNTLTVDCIEMKTTSNGTVRWWPVELLQARHPGIIITHTYVDFALKAGGVEWAYSKIGTLKIPYASTSLGLCEWVVDMAEPFTPNDQTGV